MSSKEKKETKRQNKIKRRKTKQKKIKLTNQINNNFEKIITKN